MKRSGIVALTTGRPASPPRLTVVTSAGPSRRPRSEGLIGAASMRTTTSSAAGSGVATGTSDSSSSPDAFTSERSCRPSFAMAASPLSFLACDGLQHGGAGGVEVLIQPRDPPISDGHDQAGGHAPVRTVGQDSLDDMLLEE